jgi:segregation and condensation protein B
MTPLKLKVEAVLFASGRKLDAAELAQLTGGSKPKVQESLKELYSSYKAAETSLMLIQDGEHWKLSVKEEFMPLVRGIVAETELPKAVLETLAVVAWKSPILQADVIKLRNNKAYEHIAELVDSGFIAKERHGRSYKLRLTQKFEEYFDLDEIKLKKRLQKQA